MKFIRIFEPLWWLLFGAGGFMAALVLPGLLLVIGLAFPLGWFGEPAVTFHRMHILFGNPIGHFLLIAVISLVFWHSAHHLRHFALDLGLSHLEAPVSYVLYAIALAGTLASVAIVGAL